VASPPKLLRAPPSQHATLSPPPNQDKKRGGIYEAPCYRVKARKGFNFVTTFSLRTEEDKAKWILRGVGECWWLRRPRFSFSPSVAHRLCVLPACLSLFPHSPALLCSID
jgi:hypothetical protein